MDNLLVLIVLVIISVCQAQVSIITAPQNQAVLKSQSATFQCRVQQGSGLDSSGYIAWEECITLGEGGCLRISNDANVIYSDLGGDSTRGDRYDITPNAAQKQFDLTISGSTGVLLEDGGQYKCESRNNANIKRFAELIILDDDPVCTRNTTTANEAVEGEYIKTTCTVTYEGRWAPVMAFTRNGADITAVDESNGNTVTYSYTLVVGPSNNGDVYSIRTYFNTPSDAGTNEATNRPSYEKNFAFDPLTAWYSPKDITIMPDETIFAPDDILTCTATANPAANYQWIDTNTTEILSSSSHLTITVEMLGAGSYRCRAYNAYGQETADVEVTVVSTKPISTGAIVGIAVGAAVLIVVIIIIIVVCKRKQAAKNKEKKANESRPPVKLPGTDVIRNPAADKGNNLAFPDDKVGHNPGPYDPYSQSGPYDVEVPPYEDVDDERKNRNVENLTYADLALEDVPRSRKPIQVLDPTDYAEIRRDPSGKLEPVTPSHQPPKMGRSDSRNSYNNASLPRSNSSDSSPGHQEGLLSRLEHDGPPQRSVYNPGYNSVDRYGSVDRQGSVDRYGSVDGPYGSMDRPRLSPSNSMERPNLVSRSPSGGVDSVDRGSRSRSPTRNPRSPYSPTVSPNAINELQFRFGQLASQNNQSAV